MYIVDQGEYIIVHIKKIVVNPTGQGFNDNIFEQVLYVEYFLIKPKKKVIKLIFFKKTEPGSNQPVLVRFGFLGQKSVQTLI